MFSLNKHGQTVLPSLLNFDCPTMRSIVYTACICTSSSSAASSFFMSRAKRATSPGWIQFIVTIAACISIEHQHPLRSQFNLPQKRLTTIGSASKT